ncbi:hypothetical protein NA8A_21341 [Nitratireductor indicus C115]|uniref:Uncharacterized protein n=1 Tax=Nitratireductor indicus C115 TaxID=1231190 RepID=K2NR30_9HYPH|nr:hypothetical protein NA8A_21341 [Nitratireductor indicus C115]SFQ80707.1 hypothetical protein SAMN05216176_11846 [Nitratireductor indicus]
MQRRGDGRSNADCRRGRLRFAFQLAISGALLAAASAVFVSVPSPVVAQESWPEKKCRLFSEFKADILAQLGIKGMSEAFLKAQDDFITGGCRTRIPICPVTAEEIEFSNLLSLQMMNAGATGSFLPFSCVVPPDGNS